MFHPYSFCLPNILLEIRPFVCFASQGEDGRVSGAFSPAELFGGELFG